MLVLHSGIHQQENHNSLLDLAILGDTLLTKPNQTDSVFSALDWARVYGAASKVASFDSSDNLTPVISVIVFQRTSLEGFLN